MGSLAFENMMCGYGMHLFIFGDRERERERDDDDDDRSEDGTPVGFICVFVIPVGVSPPAKDKSVPLLVLIHIYILWSAGSVGAPILSSEAFVCCYMAFIDTSYIPLLAHILKFFGMSHFRPWKGLRLDHSFSNVGFLFFMPACIASGTSFAWIMALFQTAV